MSHLEQSHRNSEDNINAITQEQVKNMEHCMQRELCREQSQEPLGGVHMRLQCKLQEVVIQVRKLVLEGKEG